LPTILERDREKVTRLGCYREEDMTMPIELQKKIPDERDLSTILHLIGSST
jgi:hypothetical protein